MKYKVKHPEVDIRRNVQRCAPGEKGINSDYEVTFADGTKRFIMEKELHSEFVPVSVNTEVPKADMIRKIAQNIIDSEVMVDDSNAEYLLHDAVEAAQAIKKLL